MNQNSCWRAAVIIGALCFFSAEAELPPDLPGEEITHDVLSSAVPKDTAPKTAAHGKANGATGVPWLDKAQKTWDAPPLSEQAAMAAGETAVPIGKGGIFIPRFTAAINEPDVVIVDSAGGTVASGNTGRVFSVEPGSYRVFAGSGARNQRMARPVTVEEGKTTPVIPDWAGLAVETVDSMAIPFRGEYELVRIDEFETYGRGFGANPEQGEVVKTRILNPGVYKILGVGQGYNSITNFVTVKLMPGELCKFLLVQDTVTYRILGGGTVEVTPHSKITSHWKYGANIGGNIKFNSEIIRTKETRMSTLFGMLSTLWLNYQRHPYEWRTRVRLDEGFNFSGNKIGDLLTDADDFLLNSLFIWRYLSWLGPFGSAEIRTTFLPRRFIRDESSSFFCLLDDNAGIIDPSTTSFDSSHAFRLMPSFTPLLINTGIGVNADALKYSFLETNVRAGFGGSYSHFPRQYEIADTSMISLWETMRDSLRDSVRRSVILQPRGATSVFSFGPQASLSGMLRIARFITADGELKILAPIAPEQRLMRPDFDLLTNISWRLSNWITLDYTYTFLLRQPENTDARLDKSTHGIWLRFSFSSR
jgi:hypothetical protein